MSNSIIVISEFRSSSLSVNENSDGWLASDSEGAELVFLKNSRSSYIGGYFSCDLGLTLFNIS